MLDAHAWLWSQIHALQQEKNGLQAEIQSLLAKTREHVGGKERLEKTLVQVTSRLKVGGKADMG